MRFFGNRRDALFFHMLLMLVVPLAALGQPAEPCAAWMASVQDYDVAFEKVMRGEPEDLLRLVKEARDPERKAGARETIEGKLAGLREIDPPADLASIHGKLIALAEAVAEAVETAQPEDAALRTRAPIACYAALLDYYRELRDLLRGHGCEGGDLEALENRIIPGLEAMMEEEAVEIQ